MATPRNTPRSPRPSAALPADVRWMNAAAACLYALAALGLLAAAVLWMSRANVFTIRALTLDASLSRTNLATVRAHALPRVRGNFFSIDLDATRAAFESVPWVRRAVVRRVWPNKIAVTLEEHQAAALWQGEGADKGAERLVNTYGELFESNVGEVEDEDLPTLAGPDAQSAHMLSLFHRLGAALAPLDEQVTGLRLSSRGTWRAELDGGATVDIGRGDDDELLARIERLVRTLPTVATRFGGAPRALVSADLRHPDGYALRLAGVSTQSTAAGSAASPR